MSGEEILKAVFDFDVNERSHQNRHKNLVFRVFYFKSSASSLLSILQTRVSLSTTEPPENPTDAEEVVDRS